MSVRLLSYIQLSLKDRKFGFYILLTLDRSFNPQSIHIDPFIYCEWREDETVWLVVCTYDLLGPHTVRSRYE